MLLFVNPSFSLRNKIYITCFLHTIDFVIVGIKSSHSYIYIPI